MKNKKNSETNNKVKKHKLNKKNITVLIIGIIVALALMVGGYFLLGLIPTIVLVLGISIILLIGHLLDKSKTKKKKHKILKTIFIIILVMGIIGCVAGGAFIIYIVKNAPSFDKELLKEKQSSVLYDSKNEEYAKIGTQIRENIEYSEISEVLIDAIIATEDSRFFQHNGFDLMRFAKAAVGQLMGHSDAGGGSTLSMQVVKNTFTDASADQGIKGIIRKFTDIYISIFQLEKNYTKEEIIEFYVNNHMLGGVWGVQEASQYYFNKNASELNLSEAALIAGIFKSPKYYNPYNYPKNAESRRNTVLYLMERHGYITAEERKLAKSIPIDSLLAHDTDTSGSEYQGYIDTVAAEVKSRYGVDPYSTSVLIYTNMVRSKQDVVNNAMNNDKNSWWVDSVRQGATVVLNSSNGKIEAIGTGRHRTTKKSYNYATSIKRQIGSTAKPLFDYAPGMEYNNWSTYTMFDDEKGYTYSNGTPIKNYDGKWEGPITLRRALSNSRNIPALKAFQQVDNKKIIELVTSVGITPEISNGYIHEAHAIGSFTGSDPLTMAGAYQIFSNGGYYYEPYTVSKIVFRTSGEEYEYSSPKQKIISDSTAYMITDVLKSVVTSTMRRGMNDIMAAKTGTTNITDAQKKAHKITGTYLRDLWVVGYTKETVISCWLGYDEINAKYRLGDADYTRRYVFFNAIARGGFNHTGQDWTMPSSVVRSQVEKLSDPPMLPSQYTPKDQILTELFKRGTEPTEVSTKYMKIETPKNLNVTWTGTNAFLSWNSVNDPKYVENDVLGYYVYFNDKLLGFTTETSYTVQGLDSFYGTYSVKAGYKESQTSMSDAATYTLEEKKDYRLTISNTSYTYKLGSVIDESYYNGGLIKLFENNNDITDKAKITIKIMDASGVQYSKVPNDKVGIWTITYTVTYGSWSGTTSNKVTVVE